MDQSREKKVTLNLEEVMVFPDKNVSEHSSLKLYLNHSDFLFRKKLKKTQIQSVNNGEELDSYSIHQMRKMQF